MDLMQKLFLASNTIVFIALKHNSYSKSTFLINIDILKLILFLISTIHKNLHLLNHLKLDHKQAKLDCHLKINKYY